MRTYPAGVPCWVEGLHRDPQAARDFYGPLMGWEFEGSGDDPQQFVARHGGHAVAGMARLPERVEAAGAVWMTHVAVESAAGAAEAATAAGGGVLPAPMGPATAISDPAGAVFCVREGGGAELVNDAGAWSMSSLRTPDPEAAAAFYGRLFGWRSEPFGPPEANVSLFRLPGHVGGTETQPVPRDVVAVMMPLEPGQAAHWHLDFWVSDTEGAVATARDLGGDVVIEPYDAPPAFRQAVLADPQGAAFSISQLMTTDYS